MLDRTGDKSIASAQQEIDVARNAGYQVLRIYVTTPTDVVLERNAARDRSANPAEVAKIHESVSGIVRAIASNFDSFRLVDTTHTVKGDPAYIIATATRGQPINVTDQPAYDAFLAKNNGRKV